MEMPTCIIDAARRCFDGKASDTDKQAVAKYGDALRAYDKGRKDRARAMRKRNADGISAADEICRKAEAEMNKAELRLKAIEKHSLFQ